MWIEPSKVPSFSSPANITLLCQVLHYSFSHIHNFLSPVTIGTALPNQPLLWENVNAGGYQIVGVGKDNEGGESNTTVLAVNVWGPVVAPLSPTNASSISNTVVISLQVCFIKNNERVNFKRKNYMYYKYLKPG